jgi:hypothetical protein
MRKTVIFERCIASLMTAEELRAAERILARLIAAAYAADHPELFGKQASGSGLDLTVRPQDRSVQASRGHQLTETTGGP